MSPASVRHGQLQAALAVELAQQLPDGVTITECPIVTDIGIRVPDLAWASAQFMTRHEGRSPLPRAPEICMEVVSPLNVLAEITEKTRAYLAAGATEVWLVTENGNIRIIDPSGEKTESAFPISVQL
jgi:Uma2 family endonuclease